MTTFEPTAVRAVSPLPVISTPPTRSVTGIFTPYSLFLIASLFIISFITDVLSKDILSRFPAPLTLSLSQFAMSALSSFLYLWFTSPRGLPAASSLPVLLLPITAVHAVGFLMTNLSLFSLPVSFTHTVKASESLFTAFLSAVFLSMPLSPLLLLSLLPIVAGVAISSWSEGEFHLLGFAAAITSNLCFALRSVLSTRLMRQQRLRREDRDEQEGAKSSRPRPPQELDDVSLYFFISLLAALLLLPVWYVLEYPTLPPLLQPFVASLSSLPARLQSASSLSSSLWSVMTSSLLLSLLVNGCLHYTYNQASFLLLSRLSPLTHVVLNACRRLFTIYTAVAWYGVGLTRGNVIGSALVVGGVLWFSVEKGKMDRLRGAAGAGKGKGRGTLTDATQQQLAVPPAQGKVE